MYRNILIPTDGSELAGKAVTHGIALAKALGAKVTGLTVYQGFDVMSAYLAGEGGAMALPAEMEKVDRQAREHAATVLKALSDAAAAAGISCETVSIEHSQPYQAIIDTAKGAGCDLICIASHGRGGATALILGSVTAKVLTHSTIPVLVYR